MNIDQIIATINKLNPKLSKQEVLDVIKKEWPLPEEQEDEGILGVLSDLNLAFSVDYRFDPNGIFYSIKDILKDLDFQRLSEALEEDDESEIEITVAENQILVETDLDDNQEFIYALNPFFEKLFGFRFELIETVDFDYYLYVPNGVVLTEEERKLLK